jgi:hypothetical protein
MHKYYLLMLRTFRFINHISYTFVKNETKMWQHPHRDFI